MRYERYPSQLSLLWFLYNGSNQHTKITNKLQFMKGIVGKLNKEQLFHQLRKNQVFKFNMLW